MSRAQPGKSSDASPELTIRPGPWTQDTWTMEESRNVAGLQRSFQTCSVEWCEQPVALRGRVVDGHRVSSPHRICKSHVSRWARAGRPDLGEFVDDQRTAKPFRVDPRRPIPAVDWLKFPQPMRDELRYVVGEMIHQGRWTIAYDLRRFLIDFGDFAASLQERSLLDRESAWWSTRWATYCVEQGFGGRHRTSGRGQLNSTLRLLEDALDPDPWARDYWVPSRMRIAADAEVYTVCDWRPIEQGWLKQAMKAYAKDSLVTRARAWATVGTWSRAVCLLDRYLVSRGGVAPTDLDRPVFLAFLEWVRETQGTETKLRLVNIVANLLGDLRSGGYVPELPDVQYLRHGENPSKRVRAPRPIPADVLSQIERIITTAPELSVTERRLLAVFRYGGPRPSEAVVLPLDSLKVTASGSHWIEYYMPKIQDWRRFPIPDQLGRELAEQRAWVEQTYGPEAPYLFPSERRSAPRTADFPGRCRPWSTNGLRKKLTWLFESYELAPSVLTSETVGGGELHRFRHTIATELLNNDWTQYEVQLFLGHKSPTMMQHYGKLNDDRLAKKYKAAIGLVDKDGEAATVLDGADMTVERLRERLRKAALPNGFCALPESQKCSFRPNPCLDCSFFRTGKEFLGVHIKHRDEVAALVARAKEDGNERVVELNEPMLLRLEALIPRIEAAPDVPDLDGTDG